MDWAKREHQVCLGYLIYDVQYAVEAGDAVFEPCLKGLFISAPALALFAKFR